MCGKVYARLVVRRISPNIEDIPDGSPTQNAFSTVEGRMPPTVGEKVTSAKGRLAGKKLHIVSAGQTRNGRTAMGDATFNNSRPHASRDIVAMEPKN